MRMRQRFSRDCKCGELLGAAAVLKRSILVCLATLLSGLAIADSPHDTERVVVRDLGADHFVAGDSIRIDKPIVGDLLAAGGEVEVNAPIGGDAALAGGKIRFTGSVSQDAYIAGGQLDLSGSVGRNARIAGGQIETDQDLAIFGNATVTGGDVKLRGKIAGYLQTAGGRVLLDGAVDGDVVATAGELKLGPNARIAGKLHYASRKAVSVDPSASVSGGIERMTTPPMGRDRIDADDRRLVARGVGLVWTLGLMLLAGLFVGAFPKASSRVAEAARARFGFSLLLGFIALICIPFAVLILLFTLVGIPLALLVLGAYFVIVFVGYVAGCIAVREWILQILGSARANKTGWRLGAAVAAVLGIALLTRAPLLGGLVALFVLLLGVGAIVVSLAPKQRFVRG